MVVCATSVPERLPPLRGLGLVEQPVPDFSVRASLWRRLGTFVTLAHP